MYDPELGRFTGVDPFMTNPLNAQTMNAYSYVNNNPIMGTDPTGYASASVNHMFNKMADQASGKGSHCSRKARGCSRKNFGFASGDKVQDGLLDEGSGSDEMDLANLGDWFDAKIVELHTPLFDSSASSNKVVGTVTITQVDSDPNEEGGAGSADALTFTTLTSAAILEGLGDAAVFVGRATVVGLSTILSGDTPQAGTKTQASAEEIAAAEVAGTTAAKEQVKNAGDNRRAAIGENQMRVLRAAATLGAITIKFPERLLFNQPLSPQQEMLSLAFNKAWIETLMNNNFTIYDVGRDPQRVGNGTPISKWYALELQAIYQRKYPNYVPVRIKE